jgi:hypothetical protein
LSVIELTPEKQDALFSIVASVLHLGSISFKEKDEGDDHQITLKNARPVNIISKVRKTKLKKPAFLRRFSPLFLSERFRAIYFPGGTRLISLKTVSVFFTLRYSHIFNLFFQAAWMSRGCVRIRSHFKNCGSKRGKGELVYLLRYTAVIQTLCRT